MKAAPFERHEPSSIDEAVTLLDRHDDATVLAGGQSLVPIMRFRLSTPSNVIDINGVAGLDALEERDGHLHVGALVRHADVEGHPVIEERYGAFADAAPQVADPLVRNRGTVVGSIAHADPAGDWGAVAIAHGGSVTAHGPDGEREIPCDELFVLPFETSLEPGELLTALRVPVPDDREGSSYHKLKRKVGDFAAVGVAARLALDADGRIDDAGLGLAAVDIANTRAAEAEAELRGERPDPDVFRRAGEAASEECDPESDAHGSERYKREMVHRLTQRALADAAERTGAVTVAHAAGGDGGSP